MKRLLFILTLTLCTAVAGARELPECARPDSSHLCFPGSREKMARFANRLQTVKQCPDSSVTIWHIGGSHVQAGWLSSRIRHNFDSLGLYPAGSRGYVFPYPLAHTNFDRSYTVRGEGEWLGTRSSNPNKKVPVSPAYGIMGIAAYTADSLAAFSFGLPEPFIGLHILGQASDTIIRPYVIAGADTLLCERDETLRGYYVAFDAPMDSVRVELRLQGEQHFTVTGLLPETLSGGGVKYVSTGVNGARTTTWTDRCPEFDRELSLVHPDLVILGLGINDSTCPAKDFKPEKFKANYRKLLDRILEQSPDCMPVFITNNDSWRYVRRRMVHNDNGDAVRLAMFELAEEYGGAVWDLYSIMGGSGSATAWRDAGLMKNDRLHFTREGYELLGDMLYGAIIDECAE
jgi:lysophospholipase L1-like esterase